MHSSHSSSNLRSCCSFNRALVISVASASVSASRSARMISPLTRKAGGTPASGSVVMVDGRRPASFRRAGSPADWQAGCLPPRVPGSSSREAAAPEAGEPRTQPGGSRARLGQPGLRAFGVQLLRPAEGPLGGARLAERELALAQLQPEHEARRVPFQRLLEQLDGGDALLVVMPDARR